MPEIRLAPDLAHAYPHAALAVVTATGLRGDTTWPATATALTALEEAVADGSWAPADETDPRIACWHEAYRAFNVNPRRLRPSVDALGRRLVRKGTLPRINGPVDTYNLVSVRHGLPIGAFDLDSVVGDITIRFAEGTESFTPLGEADTTEHPRPGEVIYTDHLDVLTRCWNHRDAHRTRVTDRTRRAWFILESLTPDSASPLRDATEDLVARLTPHTDQVHARYLGSQQSSATG
ncbi:B3/B4 domain-containing protein [Actinoalloteichus spitiensis]|uniref:B3/B4 domain-containing protein n=1 Tax=Actinoalloteichus spitiensis TaxID=252394 RepID=UPI000377205B|nr:phenylalanine--tRNA ligase beta subunit-related protein [Actinoalloteichus spitiensis]